MHALFPPAAPDDDVFGGDAMRGVLLSDGAPAKPRLNRWKAHQLRQTKTKRAKKESNAVSDMGLFGLLPGELRNFIYRLAFVPPTAEQPVVIAGSDLICGRGACVHKLAAVAAPAIASSCSQLRNEIMPIFAAENEFRLDAVMVRNRCAAFWAKSLNTYARLVKKVTLEVLIQTRIRTAIGGTDNQVGEITITCPVGSADGRFAVACTANISKANLDTSQLLPLVERLNNDEVGERGRASKLAFILGSDELADLVFWLHGRKIRRGAIRTRWYGLQWWVLKSDLERTFFHELL
ncbi:hypothetical protein LTR53_012048 [Teratosphaeriaceae sp. CCFEE 6253]|nr:hypothetical protein LTR53_012048 [Teratosphaeriaceae sp. CCFEE 6253]